MRAIGTLQKTNKKNDIYRIFIISIFGAALGTGLGIFLLGVLLRH